MHGNCNQGIEEGFMTRQVFVQRRSGVKSQLGLFSSIARMVTQIRILLGLDMNLYEGDVTFVLKMLGGGAGQKSNDEM